MTDTPDVSAIDALIEMLSIAATEEGVTIFDHTPEEIGLHVMENHNEILAALTRAQTPTPADHTDKIAARMGAKFVPSFPADQGDLVERVARSVLLNTVHAEARQRHIHDATQSGFEYHLVIVAAEHGARAAIATILPDPMANLQRMGQEHDHAAELAAKDAVIAKRNSVISEVDRIIGDHTISSPDALEQIRKIVVAALANAKAARP